VNRPALALGALAALAGCHGLPSRPDLPPTPEARALLAALPDWRAQGRVAVRSAAGGFSASFDWHETGDHFELGVHGPFGAGAARISRTAEVIRIESGEGPTIELPSPFAALEPALVARLGFPLPIESLRYWVLGVPAPGMPSDAGQGGEFRQAGWTVSLAAFEPVSGAPGPLPSRLVLTRQATRIRVIIDTWQVGTP
jgi:outer membrane lipoprotein LolB